MGDLASSSGGLCDGEDGQHCLGLCFNTPPPGPSSLLEDEDDDGEEKKDEYIASGYRRVI